MPSSVAASTLASQPTTPAPSLTSPPLSGAVPGAQLSWANVTAKTAANAPSSAGASAPSSSNNVKSDMQMNGSQGVSQPGVNGAADHGRKPSVVISASGASGSYPNGGPVQNGSRPAISFGSMNAQGAEPQANAPFQHQNASLPAPARDPRITSPAHSPSPIPQPPASGGRPPSISGQNGGGLAFGSLPADTEIMRGQVPTHERRPSSHSMQSSMSNQGVNMASRPYPPQGRGSGRGYAPPQPYMSSPGPGYRTMHNQQPRGSIPPQFSQQGGPPGSPFRQPASASPVPMPAQPHMGQGHMGGNQHMHFHPGYQQHLNPQQQQAMYGMPQFDPTAGYYNPYSYGYGGYSQPPQSPRPNYPSPFPGPPSAGMQPPFHPPGTPSMARTPSQASERPPSSLGHPQTPSQNTPAPSQTPNSQQPPASASSSFVRPVKKSNAIKITDANGNAINFGKPSPSPSTQAQPQAPVIVSTPNAPTPPPRVGSSQHNRVESKSTKSAEETKSAFAEQIKRQVEENKRKEQEGKDAQTANEKKVTDDAAAAESKAEEEKEQKQQKEQAQQDEAKKATAAAEEAAAKAAADKKAEDDAAAAKKAVESEEEEKKRKEKEEEDRIEAEIAEMEAREKEEEAREKAFQEKRAKEKAAAAAKQAERDANVDEELKRQEREAEAREEAREREREAENTKADEEPDEEAKSLFASLKKPALGPGAAASASGTETPTSEGTAGDTESEAAPAAPAAARSTGTPKPKPAHLKLETAKQVERAEPTPGMQALKSARFLEIQEEAKYPDGFKSPNPALNQAGQRKGRAYDKTFLLQFQPVFKEKPSVDWDQKVTATLGPSDEPGSARLGSARTPSGAMGPRQTSNRPGGSAMNSGPMGNFGSGSGPRTLPAGTTSEQRFQASQMGAGPARGGPGMGPGIARAPSNLGMGAPGVGMSRNSSLQGMGHMGGPNSPRQPSARGKGPSRRDDRQQSKRQEADMANKMPLTAHMEIKSLEKSQTGWKPTSIGQPIAAGPDLSGNMTPDIVQRKVKAALNKLTPEKFDKISDQILEIAQQSKSETDGRTLRQVIQLTFEKACDEAHWAGMYAKFCHKMLTAMSSEIRDETIKDKNNSPVVGGALFRKYLLNRCQEEFERGWQANLPDKPEGEEEAALLTDDYYIAAAAKRKGLGLIQFIGQLYKLRMLTLRIMHECVMRLLNFEGEPDEAAIENMTTLLKSVGATMADDPQGRALVDQYFQRIEGESILKNDKLPSRPRFMIMDLIDLRKAGWKGKDDSKGPKTIQQIHEEAQAAQLKQEQERARNPRGGPGRPLAGRGDARNFSGGAIPPPVDHSRTTVGMDDLRKLQQRGQSRQGGATLGPGGGLGLSGLGPRAGSRRGVGNLGPASSGNTTRTNTPPVDGKKDEPSTAQNAFSALAALDPSGETAEEKPEVPQVAEKAESNA